MKYSLGRKIQNSVHTPYPRTDQCMPEQRLKLKISPDTSPSTMSIIGTQTSNNLKRYGRK